MLKYRLNLNPKYVLIHLKNHHKINYHNLETITSKDIKILYKDYSQDIVDDFVWNCFVKYFNKNIHSNIYNLKMIEKIIKNLKIKLDFYAHREILNLHESQFTKIRPLKTQATSVQEWKNEKIYFQFLNIKLTFNSTINYYNNNLGDCYISNKRIIFENDEFEKTILIDKDSQIKIERHKIIIKNSINFKDKSIININNPETFMIAIKRSFNFKHLKK